jgi:hypothetical protein
MFANVCDGFRAEHADCWVKQNETVRNSWETLPVSLSRKVGIYSSRGSFGKLSSRKLFMFGPKLPKISEKVFQETRYKHRIVHVGQRKQCLDNNLSTIFRQSDSPRHQVLNPHGSRNPASCLPNNFKRETFYSIRYSCLPHGL